MNAKIALATEGNEVAAHFGHCPAFTIVEVEDGREESREVIANPGHQPGFLPRFLSGLGVTHIIAGGMGPAARNLFEQHGVTVIIGAQGSVDGVLQAFLSGSLATGPSQCHHGEADHHCGGHGHGC
ncbi:MAG: NifB/NifX family molybdenum-iron cluster-binding protein [Thermoanaerobacterales bacterium]|nr:NifB/NifX family molybdenum-iron cluster-binding protein [Bacillota bacterium]MDI6906887.1 NifB/NifX family molybdenum-iron cluster-binding protein [Thermoanaerobacterales bacterium]